MPLQNLAMRRELDLAHCLWQKKPTAANAVTAAAATSQKSFLTEVGYDDTPTPPPMLPTKTRNRRKVR